MLVGETNHSRKPSYLHPPRPLTMDPENAKRKRKNKKPLNQTFIVLKNFGFGVFFCFQGVFCCQIPRNPLFWWGIWNGQSILSGTLVARCFSLVVSSHFGLRSGYIQGRGKELRVSGSLTWKNYGKNLMIFFQDSGVLYIISSSFSRENAKKNPQKTRSSLPPYIRR